MGETHIAEYFKKTFTESNTFLADIWHETVLNHLHFINDFVENKSHDSSNITTENARKICRRNAKCSQRHTNLFENADLQGDRPIIQQASTTHQKCILPMFVPPWTPETLITDDLLDSFAIPRGTKRKRQNKFYKYSNNCYNYLRYCIGSERNVKLRRWFLPKRFIMNNTDGVTCEVIGSRAEGLDMEGSDIDLMEIIDKYGAACEQTTLSEINNETVRIHYKSSNISPGYVLVEICLEGRNCSLSSSLLKDLGIRFFHSSKYLWSTKAHGPALAKAPLGMDTDLVLAFKTETWPEIANEWILRERKFGWPSQETVNDIANKGCCIVPVGSKASKETNETEWRLSFALAEKDLIFSFNHTQLLVYGLLKFILKEVVNPIKEISELLCSYFLKTTLFWMIEETHACLWKPQLIILCFQLCLERLIQFIVEENCPNYFVRTNNMFHGRFLNGKEQLLQILCGISCREISLIVQSKTINKLKCFIQQPFTQKRQDLWEITSHVFELIYCCKMAVGYACNKKDICYRRWLKSLLEVPIVRKKFRKEICHFIDYLHISSNDNKNVYSMHKLHLYLLCEGCNSDPVAGTLLFASWLYNNGKFIECLEFADLAFERLNTFSEFLVYCTHRIDFATEVDFIEHALRFRKSEVIGFYENSCLLPVEIKRAFLLMKTWLAGYENQLVENLIFYPEPYYHFLRFLCLYKLGEIERSYEELTALDGNNPQRSRMNVFLRFAGNMAKHGIGHEWTSQTNIILDIMQNLHRLIEGINMSHVMSLQQQLDELGVDPSFFQKLLQQNIRQNWLLSEIYTS